MFWKDVLLRRITARTWETSLWLVGAHSLRFVIFAASSGCAAPPQLHIAPFCPQRSCCGLFCVFRASLLFSTSVNLKCRNFKFTEVEAEKSNANAVDENSRYPFFTCTEQTLHAQSLRQPIGIIFTPSGRVYASSPPVMTINKSGSRRFVLPEAFAARTSCLI